MLNYFHSSLVVYCGAEENKWQKVVRGEIRHIKIFSSSQKREAKITNKFSNFYTFSIHKRKVICLSLISPIHLILSLLEDRKGKNILDILHVINIFLNKLPIQHVNYKRKVTVKYPHFPNLHPTTPRLRALDDSFQQNINFLPNNSFTLFATSWIEFYDFFLLLLVRMRKHRTRTW